MARLVSSACMLVAILIAAPATAAAQGHSHFPSSIDTTIPAGGNSVVTSPTIDPDAEVMEVVVNAFDGIDLNQLELAFSEVPSRKARAAFCFIITLYGTVQNRLANEYATGPDELAILFLSTCLAMARDVVAKGGAVAARGPCPAARRALPIALTRVGRKRYSLTTTGKPRTPRGKGKLKVSCRARGGKATLRLRARGGRTLRKAVGSKIRIGIQSSETATKSTPVTVTFREP